MQFGMVSGRFRSFRSFWSFRVRRRPPTAPSAHLARPSRAAGGPRTGGCRRAYGRSGSPHPACRCATHAFACLTNGLPGYHCFPSCVYWYHLPCNSLTSNGNLSWRATRYSSRKVSARASSSNSAEPGTNAWSHGAAAAGGVGAGVGGETRRKRDAGIDGRAGGCAEQHARISSAHASPSPCAPDSLSRFVVRKRRSGSAVLALVMR